MPRVINGVGTRFYGESNWRSDASFQTTEWLVMLYVPVVPFKSLRVRHDGGNSYPARLASKALTPPAPWAR